MQSKIVSCDAHVQWMPLHKFLKTITCVQRMQDLSTRIDQLLIFKNNLFQAFIKGCWPVFRIVWVYMHTIFIVCFLAKYIQSSLIIVYFYSVSPFQEKMQLRKMLSELLVSVKSVSLWKQDYKDHCTKLVVGRDIVDWLMAHNPSLLRYQQRSWAITNYHSDI